MDKIEVFEGVECRTIDGLVVCRICGGPDPDNDCDGCSVRLCDSCFENEAGGCPTENDCYDRWKAKEDYDFKERNGICHTCDAQHDASGR